MVITATTWPAASIRGAAPSPDELDSEQLGGGGGAGTAPAFGALLEATRVLLNTGQESSASQMFETDIRDAHQARQSALHEEYRASSLSPQSDGRLDATSVRARRALRESQNCDDVSHRSAEPGSRTSARVEGERSSSSMSELSWLSDKGAHHGGADSSLSSRGVHRSGAARSASAAAPHLAPPAPVVAESASVQQQAVSVNAAAVSAGAPAQSSGSPGGSVAHQVAQILGAGRAGEVESARVPTTPSTPQQARSSPQDQKSADKATPDYRSASKAPAGSSDETGATARSAFDRLVRSIRLRTGTYRSFARMHLHPPELGRMLVSVRMAGDELQINVRTETAKARELLYERAGRLRATLEQHGIYVGRFEVTNDFADNRSDAPVTPDGFQPAGGERRAYRRTDSSRSADREIRHDGGASDRVDGDFDAAVVAERRLDVRI